MCTDGLRSREGSFSIPPHCDWQAWRVDQARLFVSERFSPQNTALARRFESSLCLALRRQKNIRTCGGCSRDGMGCLLDFKTSFPFNIFTVKVDGCGTIFRLNSTLSSHSAVFDPKSGIFVSALEHWGGCTVDISPNSFNVRYKGRNGGGRRKPQLCH